MLLTKLVMLERTTITLRFEGIPLTKATRFLALLNPRSSGSRFLNGFEKRNINNVVY